MRLIAIFLIFLLFDAHAAEFGQYQYSKYLGIQQQMQRQRYNAIRKQRMYSKSPTRNIRYPNSTNPYPNIQRQSYRRISPQQRYSARYYQTL